MNVKVQDIMVAVVMTTTRHQTVAHVRKVMHENKVGSIPVVNSEGEPLGIVTATDMLAATTEGTRIGSIMQRKVYSVSRYDSISEAARVMRNHRIHHVVVTHERKVIGILSTFDLLRLVEEHRFVMKNAPTTSKKVRRRSGGRPETTIGGEN